MLNTTTKPEKEPRDTNVELTPSAITPDGHWAILRLEKISVHMKQSYQGKEYEAWVSVVPTEHSELRVAHQLIPGAPPPPSDALGTVAVQDLVTEFLRRTEDAVLTAMNDSKPRSESGFK